ncbi:MAG: right-handed parallel beta-helix repeat-containing protein, partial [Candidatus Micrarchaeota archaeon]|nr:right-handed parallel beta-helix repeat-containing protein [Candidatus Micrarchaeota archaeon]
NSTYGYGIMVAGSSNTIADSEFIADNYGNAISIYGGASNAISRTNANSSLGAAINAYYSPLTTISDSAGSSTSAEGIIIIEGAGSAITGSSGTSISKLGIGVMSSPDSTITGSTGTSNTDKGIALAGSQNVVISNSIARNLVSSSNGYGLYITYGSDNVQVINTNVSSNQSSAIYIDGGTGVSVDCQGRSMTGRNLTGTYGIYSNQQGTIVKNCQISNFQHGIFFDEVDYGTIQDTVANTTRAAGVGIYIYGYGNGYGLDDAAHNTITGSTGYSATGYGILLDRGHFTSITDSSGISNSGSGIAIGYSDNVGISSSVASTNTGYAALVIGASSNDTITDSTLIARGTQLGVNAGSGVTIGGNSAFNTISNCRITGKGGSAGALFSQQGSNNTFANNTIDGMGGNYVVKLTVSANGNQFIGNTILNAQISLVKLDSSSTSNLFYWNNFTLPIGSAYAIDDAGNNTWNTTIAGHGEGNIWWEIMDGTVQVLGANHSAGFPSLYYGSSGTGYPYNASANPQAKFLCLAQGCADYAPLTPYHE